MIINNTKDNIINKAEKYQTSNCILFIVGTQWYAYNDVLQTPQDTRIRYTENVKVISHALFADLIGLNGEYRTKFNNIIDHNAIENIEYLKELHQTYNTKWHGKEELKEDIRKPLVIDFTKELQKLITQKGSSLSLKLCENLITELEKSLERPITLEDIELAANFFVKQDQMT